MPISEGDVNSGTGSVEISLSVLTTAAGIAALYSLRPVVIPLVLAFVLVVLVNGLVRFLENAWGERYTGCRALSWIPKRIRFMYRSI